MKLRITVIRDNTEKCIWILINLQKISKLGNTRGELIKCGEQTVWKPLH